MIRRLMWILCVASLPALAADITTTWTYPTQNTDGSAIPASGAGSIASSRVEWGTCAGAAFGTKLGEASIPAPTRTHVATGLPPATYCVRVYATNTYGAQSDASSVASVIVNPPKPQPPVITTATVARLWRHGLGPVVGRVAHEVPCGTLQLDARRADWYTVPVDAVTLNRYGRTLGPHITVVAKCAAG